MKVLRIVIVIALFSIRLLGTETTSHSMNCLSALNQPVDRPLDINKNRLSKKLLPFFYGAAASTAFLMPVLSLAGGFSGSGGGGAVLTIKNKSDLKKANTLRNSGKPLPLKLAKRGQLRTLERFEMEKSGTTPLPFSSGESWQTILDRAYDNVRMISPVLARRLEQVSQWMAFADWRQFADLPIINDATPRHELAPTDFYLQAALRLSNGNNLAVQGPARQKVDIKVLFNQELFELFDPLDQAILVLHEQLYALGQAGGLNTSDDIRPLVTLFFSEYSQDLKERSRDGLLAVGLLPFFKEQLTLKFGDYAVYFSQVDKIQKTKDRSADRHFNLFVEVILELRDLMRECNKTGIEKAACAAKVLTEYVARDDLPPERAFVFINYFLLEKTLGIVNSEIIMNNKLSNDKYIEVLDFICKQIKLNADSMVDEARAMKAALTYCQ